MKQHPLCTGKDKTASGNVCEQLTENDSNIFPSTDQWKIASNSNKCEPVLSQDKQAAGRSADFLSTASL